MAWSDNMLQVMRGYINDLTTPYTYSDSRLEELLVIGAYHVKNEVYLATTYTINLNSPSISPDPNSDDSFVILAGLKAACLLSFSEQKTHALHSVSVSDGFSKYDYGDVAKQMKERYEYLCEEYDRLRNQYTMGNALVGQIVTGPIVYNNVSPKHGNI